MRQYEMFELVFRGLVMENNWVGADITAEFRHGNRQFSVKGFYNGNGEYKVRFYPGKEGIYTWRILTEIPLKGKLQGEENCEPAGRKKHGLVCTEGLHFRYEDGTRYIPFGTTVYALIHQEESLIRQTMQSLENSPFNKVRLCVFPKSYDYNQNEPKYFPFEKINGKWDVSRPVTAFWENLENCIKELDEREIQADIILFHGYDRWGFSCFSKQEAMIYLAYLIRRLSAFPNIWWSMANEYEVVTHFPEEWWKEFADFIRKEDTYGHLLSNHNFLKFWDFNNHAVTHCSIQDNNVIRVPQLQKMYRKPVIFDECCYEGNIPNLWGNISGFELVHRFWTAMSMGGYCTHGETFLNEEEVLWWSKGGVLRGQSPERIGFLKKIMEELPGDLEYMPSLLEKVYEKEPVSDIEDSFLMSVMNMIAGELREVSEVRRQDYFDKERIAAGHCGKEIYLKYYGRHCPALDELVLSDNERYDVELIDTWEMTREVILKDVSGRVKVNLPGKEGMAVLAKRRYQ